MADVKISECLSEYDKSFDRLAKLVQFVVQKLEAELRAKGILARVSGRVKTLDSLEKKLIKWFAIPDKAAKIKDRHDIFKLVGDLAAVRIMTYVESDRRAVEEIVRAAFVSPPHITNFGLEIKEKTDRIQSDPRNFYRATHLQVALALTDCNGTFSNLREDHCEVQITSMLAHVWNEIEHDIGYKGEDKALSEAESTGLESLGMLTKAGDNIVSALIQAHHARKKSKADKKEREAEYIHSEHELAQVMERHFGETVGGRKIDFYENAGTLLASLKYLKLNHPVSLRRVLTPKLMNEAAQKTIGNFINYENQTNTSRQRVVRDTSDIALLVLLSSYREKLISEPYPYKGQKPRHLAIALRYNSWLETLLARQRR